MIDKNIIRKILNGQVQFNQFDKNYANLAKNHQNSLTKPKGSLGNLENMQYGWQAGKKNKSQQ